MTQSNTRRTIGSLAAFAVAAGFAVTIGTGMAAAAPGELTWSDQYSTFTRTIDNVTPTGDDTITVTTKWTRTDANWEKLNSVKDYHSTCLAYVPGSAKVTDNAGVHTIEPYVQTAADFTAVDFVGLGYQPTAKKGVETPILSIQYKVGYNCDRDTTLATGMSYSGSRGPGSYPTKGPSIKVAKNTSTTVLATVPAGVKVDQTVPLNATVTGGIDGDIVEFYDGTTKLGQGTLAAGKATFAWSPALGAHSVTAKFLGTTKATESVSAAQNVTVSPADVTTTTTVSGDATGVVGTNVALSAKVSPAPSLGGTVQFKDGATNIGGLVDLDAHGNAATTVPLAAGTHAITAVFTGVGEYQPSTSTAPHNVTVTPANVATITTITGDTTAVTDTDAVLNVQVSPVPTGGTVQFKNGTTNIGNPVTLDGQGKGTLTTKFATTGAQSITAVYEGTTGFLTSTSVAHSVEVSAPVATDQDTTTTVTGPATAVENTDVTLGVQVSPVPTGGTVQFKNGTTNIGNPVTLDGQGKGTLTTKFATTGAQSITAVYEGTTGFLTSTSVAHSVEVSAPVATDQDTTTTVTGPATAVENTDVTLGVQVSPVPTGGTVQFKNGTTNIGNPVTLDGQGKGSITTKFATTGAQSITAVYEGTTGFLTSTSVAHSVEVSAPVATDQDTTTTVTGPATAVENTDVTLGVQVSPVPTGGTVQFKNGTTNIGNPVTLDGQGKGTLTTKFATTGAQSITAVYEGTTGFLTSTSTPHTITVTATPAETTTTVIKVPATATTGVEVNLDATISPASTGGTVQFMDGNKKIGDPVAVVNGKATLKHIFTSADTHNITAIYSDATGQAISTSEIRTVTVTDTPGGGNTGSLGSLGNIFGSLGNIFGS